MEKNKLGTHVPNNKGTNEVKGCSWNMEQPNNGAELRFLPVNGSSSYVPEEEVKSYFLFHLFVCLLNLNSKTNIRSVRHLKKRSFLKFY